MRADLRDKAAQSRRHLLPDVLQDELAGDGIEDDLAARRQERETLLNLTLQRLAADAGHRAETLVEPELAPLVSDEIQRCEHSLAARQPQAAAQLLEEDGRAFRRPQEEHSVDLWDVQAFVEEVDGEENVDRTGA